MRKKAFICLALILILLPGCSSNRSSSSSFTGGVFYSPLLTYSNGEIFEVYTFNPDGSGSDTLTSSGHSNDFTWKIVGDYVVTTRPISCSTCFLYTGNCLAPLGYQFDGKIPNKNTFDAELTLQTAFSIQYSFHKDGTMIYSTDGNEHEYTYKRNGNYISILDGDIEVRQLLVSDGMLYLDFLRPYEAEES